MLTRILALAAVFIFAAALGQAQQRTDTTPGHRAPAVGGPHYKKDKTPTSRNVKGTVTNDAGQPLEGALVTLTDQSTNEKLTFITKQDGRYKFDDLSFTKDYTIMARYKDMGSESRRLSQYDRTADVVRILQVAANAPAGAGEPKK